MALFTIGDLHLPLGVDKPMDIFGKKWENYVERLADNWQSKVGRNDTVVLVGGRVLGKPHDRTEAVGMLQALSGRSHTVITGVTLRDARGSHTFSVPTQVWFRKLTAEEIDHYVDTCKPFDKAGSYGVQEWIGYVGIERLDGSFYNVMGLPVQRLYTELEQFLQR